MKDIILKILLGTHIAGGGISLITGAIAMATVKGGKTHRLAGKIFFAAMMFVAISAFVIAIAKSIDFLLAVSVFSFYMNYTGYRALKNREVKFKWFDWVPLVFSLFAVGYMIYSLNTVLLVFGSILILFIVRDLRQQFMDAAGIKEARRLRVLTHISRMCGTYIATVTAFLVVNINFVKPGWILWLLPTVVGTLAIIYFTGEWRKKLTPGGLK